MPTLIDNLNLINSYKSEIKSAIENKGVDMTGVSFGSYAEKIGEITTTFITETLSVTQNNTYYPGTGVDGFSEVIVNVPQTGYTEKDVTEKNYGIVNLSNSASYVGSFAFTVSSSLITVNLPSCKIINTQAFSGCSSLYSVYVPECSFIDNGAFQNCIKLKTISIPKCSRLGTYAFYYCSDLTLIDLPVCSSIGDYAFAQCRSSLSMVLLRSTSVCSYTGANIVWGTDYCNFYVTKSLVESYKSTGGWSRISDRIYPIEDDFEFSNGLVTGWAKTMDSGYLNTLGITANDVTSVSMIFLTSVSSSTFMNHQNLTSVSMSLVNDYPDDLFNGTGFSEFCISVSALGNRVFANCSGLEKVTVEYNGIVNAGSNLFQNCPNLSQIGVPFDHYSDYLTAPGWSEYSSLMYQEIPLLAFSNGLVFGRTTSIDSTYRQTLGITSNQVVSVSLPNCVLVGNSTFLECHSLKDVYLPNCEHLSYGAFYGVNNMNGIELPVCSFIGQQGFYWCNNSMTYIKLGYSGVCTLGGNQVFYQCTALRSIYVPASLVEDYKVAQYWSSLATKILPITE